VATKSTNTTKQLQHNNNNNTVHQPRSVPPFAAYISPVSQLISSHGVGYHQYADDTQLFLAMRASTIHSDLLKLEMCTRNVKSWFAENDLLLNADKSEVMMIGTPSQLRSVESISTVTVADTSPMCPPIWSLWASSFFDPKLTFDKHVSAVCKACNYHIWALRHIRRVLPLDVAKTLASSIVGSRLDYSNSVLYGSPNSTILKLQRVQNCLARVVLQQRKSCHAQPLLKSLHWLPISQRIDFKLATVAYKTQSTYQPKYLHQLISSQLTGSTMSLRSSTRPLLQVPRTRTVYGSRAFSSAVPAIWNKLPSAVLEAKSLSAFRRQLKTHLFTVAYTDC